MTETAQMADIVLPATMFMEHDDLYYGGGHQHISVGAKLIEPPGECRSITRCCRASAAASTPSHRGFDLTSRELIDETLKLSGHGDIDTLHRPTCGATSSRIFARRITSMASRMRTRSFTSRQIGRTRPGATLVWVPGSRCRHCRITGPSSRRRTRRTRSGSRPAPPRSFLNSSFNETPSSIAREGPPSVMMHPADAARLGIADGDAVILGNPRGETTLTAKLFDGLRCGVLIAESVQPNHAHIGGRGIIR